MAAGDVKLQCITGEKAHANTGILYRKKLWIYIRYKTLLLVMNQAKLKKKKSSRVRNAGAELIVSGIFDN